MNMKIFKMIKIVYIIIINDKALQNFFQLGPTKNQAQKISVWLTSNDIFLLLHVMHSNSIRISFCYFFLWHVFMCLYKLIE